MGAYRDRGAYRNANDNVITVGGLISNIHLFTLYFLAADVIIPTLKLYLYRKSYHLALCQTSF